MSISMYQASVPVFVRVLGNLRAVLHKGEAFATEKGIAPEALLQTRLIVDMFPLVRQVQIAADMAKNGSFRLAGAEPPKFEDNEASFAELHARIDRTIAVIQGIDRAQIDGSEARAIAFAIRGNEVKFDGQGYLLHFVLPNLFFHSTTAYAILRENGVPLGKLDFLGGVG